jgi:hypothetical protein
MSHVEVQSYFFMSDALVIAAVLFVFIALWGVVVFLVGWKDSADHSACSSKLRRFWIVVFALCGLALLVSVFIRTTIPGNPAVAKATALALQSARVQDALGDPIRYGGVAYGGYRGIGEGSRISAGLRYKGSKQSGTLQLCGTKNNGAWKLVYAEVVPEDKVAILLTDNKQAACGY